MTIQSRIPEGVPTGGQFAAAARREAVIALHDSPVHESAHPERDALVTSASLNAQDEAEARAVDARDRVRAATSTGLSQRLAAARALQQVPNQGPADTHQAETPSAILRERLANAQTSMLADRLVAARAQHRAGSAQPLSNGFVVTTQVA